jgi:hypothetical protein
MFFAIEQLAVGPSAFVALSSIEIDAADAQVWTAIVQMRDLEDKPAAAFRLGVSHPLGAELSGEGVGAIRYGRFSTGTAIERVSAWQPAREVAFEVLSEPPAMREMSPYQHVHAPHVNGYFTTRAVRFRIEPMPDHRTRLVLESDHQLKLEPRLYWIPVARWIVGENDDRVLRHIKRQAEEAQ